MRWNSYQIEKAFGGRLLGTRFMKRVVCDTISLFPPKLITYITQHVWFLSSSEDAWAYTFDGNDLINNHFVFLSDELLEQDKAQVQYTIAHEVGHVALKHKNSIYRQQSEIEIKAQEVEADFFARKYLSLYS